MKKDPTFFLKDILESVKLIEKYTKNVSKKKFLVNKETQDAVVRRLEVIGEAARNLPEGSKQLNSKIAWRKIIAMRNLLIHEYFGVDLKLVWAVVKNNLPEFKKQIKEILKN